MTKNEKKIIKFVLNGCDISFIAEAPADITHEQLQKQSDKINPDWCACEICTCEEDYPYPTDIFIDYDSIKKANDDVPCMIEGEEE